MKKRLSATYGVPFTGGGSKKSVLARLKGEVPKITPHMNRKGLVKALLPRVRKEYYSRVRAERCILEGKLYRVARTELARAKTKKGADRR